MSHTIARATDPRTFDRLYPEHRNEDGTRRIERIRGIRGTQRSLHRMGLGSRRGLRMNNFSGPADRLTQAVRRDGTMFTRGPELGPGSLTGSTVTGGTPIGH